MRPRSFALLLVPILAACTGGPTGSVGASGSPVGAVSTLKPTPTPTPVPTPPPLSLASVFGAGKPDLSVVDQSKLRVLIATGDVIPAREVNYQVLLHKDFLYPWRQTADYLKTGDLLFINLESPLLKRCPTTRSGFTFCGDARSIAGLDYAGVNVANLANNHSTNYGPAGTSETIALLGQHGIGVSGNGLSVVRDIRGIKFGFIGFNGVGTHIDRAELKREIDLVRPACDVLVVAFHWGKEYELLPTVGPGIAPDNPRDIGHLAVDLGADLVVGNHPHWVQPVEIYHNRLIAYAHGNFIFDQMWSQETREGVVGRYTFYGTQLVRVDYKPLVIDGYAQPRWLDETTGEGKAIIDRMSKASDQLAAG
ncbi:MAG: CapA family protein [Candidatus Dormibacteraeota bacterium]|nr:CapA family protein [Candidatus Dormibacteraeota bacterium]